MLSKNFKTLSCSNLKKLQVDYVLHKIIKILWVYKLKLTSNSCKLDTSLLIIACFITRCGQIAQVIGFCSGKK